MTSSKNEDRFKIVDKKYYRSVVTVYFQRVHRNLLKTWNSAKYE